MLVRSLRDLHKLKLRFKRNGVQVTRAGGYFRARFHGHANCVLGSTAEGVLQRLLDSPEHIFRNNERNAVVYKQRNREGCK
jgi:hypothetical protein